MIIINKSSDMVRCLMLLVLLSTMLLHQAERVSAGCENIQASLLSCQDAVQGDNPPFPTPECCTTLKELSVGCLCKALAETDVPKDINKHAAFTLPSKCKVAIPPGFDCAGRFLLF
ncbi:unnamed protein product [Calypogeia fissa]